MEKASDIRIVYITIKHIENAQQIAKILVTERLAACCSIIQNVLSTFAWEGAVQERHEILMIVKTNAAYLDELEARVVELHPDEVPEIISLEADSAHEPYLNWLNQSLK